MKIKNTSDEDMTIRGVNFPKGKPVKVSDQALFAKCLAMPEFVEVKASAKNKA